MLSTRMFSLVTHKESSRTASALKNFVYSLSSTPNRSSVRRAKTSDEEQTQIIGEENTEQKVVDHFSRKHLPTA